MTLKNKIAQKSFYREWRHNKWAVTAINVWTTKSIVIGGLNTASQLGVKVITVVLGDWRAFFWWDDGGLSLSPKLKKNIKRFLDMATNFIKHLLKRIHSNKLNAMILNNIRLERNYLATTLKMNWYFSLQPAVEQSRVTRSNKLTNQGLWGTTNVYVFVYYV